MLQSSYQRLVVFLVVGLAGLFLSVPSTLAISAPIHISGTGGEGVFIRPEPNTSRPAVGWMPEGASPDYNCFVWGQNVNGVPIWFSVNYNGVTGYYASYYDDSSYHSNEELTAKYGVPLCGNSAPAAPSSPPAVSSPQPASPPSSPAPSSGSPAPAGVPALYFSPYPIGSKWDLPDDGVSKNVGVDQWSTAAQSCQMPNLPYIAGMGALGNTPPQILASWSKGRVGVTSFLMYASTAMKKAINYILLIDPGSYGEMSCDRARDAGEYLTNWLEVNPNAHLVVISTTEVTQLEHSKGIQEVYFNPIRNATNAVGHLGGNLSSRVLTCNYNLEKPVGLTSHQKAYLASRYWIQHRIGSTRNACPQLSLNGSRWNATAGWHPIN